MKAVTNPRALPRPLMLLNQVGSARVSQKRQRRQSKSSLSQMVSRSHRRYVIGHLVGHLVRCLIGHSVGSHEWAWSSQGEISRTRDGQTCPRVLVIMGKHMYHRGIVLIGGNPVPRGFGICWAASSREMLLVDTDRLALLNEAYFSS